MAGQAALLDAACSCNSAFQSISQQLVRREASSLTTTTNTESVTAVTKSLLLDTLNLVSLSSRTYKRLWMYCDAHSMLRAESLSDRS